MERSYRISICLSEPLRRLNYFIYKPGLKVSNRLKDGLCWKHTFQKSAELFASCSKLEILLERQMKNSNRKVPIGTSATISNIINNEINMNHEETEIILKLTKKIKELTAQILPNTSLKEFLEVHNLEYLFPAVINHLIESNLYNSFDRSEEYLRYVNSLNQLVSMSMQLRLDVNSLRSHKFIAHQIALLYQCLNQVGKQVLPFKKRIEERFEDIKAFIESEKSPLLPQEYRNW